MRFDFEYDPEKAAKIAEITVFRGSYDDVPSNKIVKIPEGIVEIAENAFRDFENLEEVEFPRSLRRIGASAFSGWFGCTACALSFYNFFSILSRKWLKNSLK